MDTSNARQFLGLDSVEDERCKDMPITDEDRAEAEMLAKRVIADKEREGLRGARAYSRGGRCTNRVPKRRK